MRVEKTGGGSGEIGKKWRDCQKYQDGAKNWWTGATDLGVEGVWKWARSGEIVGDFVWGEGEPGTGKLGLHVAALQ